MTGWTRAAAHVAAVAIGYGLGRWYANGGSWRLIVAFACGIAPMLAFAYWRGYQQGRDETRAAIVAKFDRIQRTVRP